MRKTLTFLAVLIVGAFSSTSSLAVEASPLEMAPVVVTANRWEQPVDETADRVTVITSEEIKALGVRDAGEALSRMVGVDLDKDAEPFSVSFPSVQGAEFYQMMVLVNGIPLSDLSQRYAAISMIPASMIDRIEVVHGPAGSEWGSMLGGVINVITVSPEREGNGSAQVGGGEHDTKFANANGRYRSESFSLSAGAAYRDSAGPEDNRHREHKNNSGMAAADIKLGDKTTLLVQGHTFQGQAGAGEYRAAYAGVWYQYRYNIAGGGMTLTTELPVGALKISAHRQDQTSYTEGFTIADDSLAPAPRIHEQTTGGSAVWHATFGDTFVTLGGDASTGTLEADELDDPSYDYNPYGLFANVQHDLGALRLQGAVRYSDEDTFGGFTAYQLAALYKVGDVAIIRASAGNGYTAPSLSTRYATGGGWFIPNPDLQVETVTQYSLGAKGWITDEFTIDANAFYAIVKDAISAVPAGDVYTYDNFAEFRRQGLETEIAWTNGPINLAANAMIVEIRDTVADAEVEGKVRASYGLFATYDDGTWLASLSGFWRDWNYSEASNGNDKEWFWNAKGGYTYPMASGNALSVGVSVHNVTDVNLYQHEALPAGMPRTAEGYVEFSF